MIFEFKVRVQCFHYLRPSSKFKTQNDPHDQHSDLLEPDAKVLKLTKVLSDMDEALSATLHPRKTKVSPFLSKIKKNPNF